MEFEITLLDCFFEVTTTCCAKPAKTWTFPYGVKPMEIARVTGMPLKKAVEIAESNKVAKNCGQVYYSDEIKELVKKSDCINNNGSFVEVIVPANMFESKLSKDDANKKALEYFNKNKQSIANTLGTCLPENCNDCPPYRISQYTECGEYRINQECREGKCVDISQPYFVCTQNCESTTCIDTTCPDICICYAYRVVRTNNCGEWRVDAECRDGKCVEITQPYFVCYDPNNECCI